MRRIRLNIHGILIRRLRLAGIAGRAAKSAQNIADIAHAAALAKSRQRADHTDSAQRIFAAAAQTAQPR